MNIANICVVKVVSICLATVAGCSSPPPGLDESSTTLNERKYKREYMWVDREGVTHYSDSLPEGMVPYTETVPEGWVPFRFNGQTYYFQRLVPDSDQI